MENAAYQIFFYATTEGKEPFEQWIQSIRDKATLRVIFKRIQRLRLGLFGDAKSAGEGVHELRIDFGPGYRIYFAKIGTQTVLLIAGGDKSSQDSDIKRAKIYLLDYRKRHDKRTP